MIYDILIIGGGVTGTAVARELSRYQLSIALLEKEAELAFGVSKSNSGIVHPGTQNPPDSLKGRLCVRGNKLLRGLSREIGVYFKQVGELIIITTAADLPRLQKLLSDGRKLGVRGLRIVDRKWLAKNEPNLSSAVPYALYAPTAGIISPYRLVYDLAENAAANGVEIFTDQLVTGVKKGRGFIVETTRRKFEARFMVNAAGLYADEVAALYGAADFKITPRKGEEYLLDKKRENLTRHIIFPLPTDKGKGMLVIKTSDGNPMIGPTAEDIEDKTDLSTTAEGFRKVTDSVREMAPCLDTRDIIAYFAGLRPVSGADFIIRAETALPGIVTVAGIQSPGLTASPAIAEYVVRLLRKAGLNLRRKKHFQKYRPATSHLFASSVRRIRGLLERDPSYGDIVCRCELVSAREIREAVRRGARTMDGVKFRTRAQAGRCHGGFCTTRIMKIIAEELKLPLTAVTKKGAGSELVTGDRRAPV
ncbi:MAG: NAD(P)/FAD-dependent oxidoreductase [Candidatus Margulisbacteria bacterium]|jgi:glycerol-3-phosphate dehydrogenase|nr:NAD(P)/FAD-dependent oxidoreductase [Candidatus Margulisiibacteriota bacterium]